MSPHSTQARGDTGIIVALQEDSLQCLQCLQCLQARVVTVLVSVLGMAGSTAAPSPLQLLTDTESRPSLYTGLVAVVSTPHTVLGLPSWWSDMT